MSFVRRDDLNLTISTVNQELCIGAIRMLPRLMEIL